MSRRTRARNRGSVRQPAPRPDPKRKRTGVWQAGNSAVSRALSEMQGAFGEDFSNVKVDSSPEAQAASDALGATAVTRDETILLSAQAPPMESTAGRRLLAHELAHVLQQRRAASVNPGEVGAPGGSFEASADLAASQAMRGQAANVPAAGAAPGVQRQQRDKDLDEKIFGSSGAAKPDKATKKKRGVRDRIVDLLGSGKEDKGPKVKKTEEPSTKGQRNVGQEADKQIKTTTVSAPAVPLPQPGEKKKTPAPQNETSPPAATPEREKAAKEQNEAVQQAVAGAMSYARASGKDTAEVALEEVLWFQSDTILPQVKQLVEAEATKSPNVKTVIVKFGKYRQTFQVGKK
jgi:hypothetical protein